MDKALKQLLDNQVLPEGVQDALLEAWEHKTSEARQQIEEQVRDELSKRYEHDKSQLVEAMEKFLHEHLAREVQLFADTKKKISEDAQAAHKALTKKVEAMKGVVVETLRKELSNIAEEKKAIAEQRAKYAKMIAEGKEEFASQSNESLTKFMQFVESKLSSELTEFMQDKKALAEERVKMHKELRESRLGYKQAFGERINKLEKFVLTQLKEEISEFETDKRLMESRRVELETQAKQKLAETQKAFIAKASRLVETTMAQTMNKEMRQLKEDLKVARENNFGRRLFEAFAAEYMTSYLAEGSEVRKLQKQINETKQQVTEAQKKLVEKDKALQQAQRKVQLTEERVERTRVMNDLLSPLPRDQKNVMANLLEGVKTEKLQESYKRYLPSVLRETGSAKSETAKKVLVEAEAKESSVALTGDRQNKMAEIINEENKDDPSVIQLRKLAGLN